MTTDNTTPQPQAPAPAKQSGYRIKSISVSLEIADKEYGNGNAAYANIQAHVDDTPIEQIEDVIAAQAWRSSWPPGKSSGRKTGREAECAHAGGDARDSDERASASDEGPSDVARHAYKKFRECITKTGRKSEPGLARE